MKPTPRVSILTACYNSREFIRETIDSALSQTFQNFEMILVDDGSRDPIKDIVDSYNSDKLHYYQKENSGPANTLNFAADQASGDYIAFLNHDDVWLRKKLEEQLEELQRRKAVWIASGCHRVNFYTKVVLERFEGKDYFKNVFYNILTQKYLWSFSSVMIQKDVFFNVGGFSSCLLTMPDRDLYIRIAKNYPIAYLSNLHVLDRFHSSNITSKTSMDRMLHDKDILISNAKSLKVDLPLKVINDANQMFYRTACIEYLRVYDLHGMRKMLELLKCNFQNRKFITYRLLSLFNDEAITKIMKVYRKIRRKLFPSKVYPDVKK